MEAMEQRRQEETEEPSMALRARQPRQHSNTPTTTSDVVLSSESFSEAEALEEEAEGNGKPINGIFSDKNGGTENPYGISQFNVGNADFFTSKEYPVVKIVEVNKEEILSFQKSDVTNHQDEDIMKDEVLPGFDSSPSKQSLEQNGHDTSLGNGTTEHGIVKLRDTSEQEVSELSLERVYEKPAAHDFYCPNCNACITKVIIREREWENRPATAPIPEPEDPVICTSCFSFLIPTGSWFFPKPVVGENRPEQGTNPENSVAVLIPSHDLNGTIQDQNNQIASGSQGPLTNESVGASVTAIAKPSSSNLGSIVGVEFPVPPHGLNDALYDQKPQIPSQSVEVSEAASITEAQVSGEPVEASVGVITTSKPSGNNFDSSVGFHVPVPSHDSNETSHNQKHPVPGLPVGVSVTVTTESSSSTIDVVTISQDSPQLGESKLDGAVGENTAGPDGSTTVIITEPTITSDPGPGDAKTIEIVKSIVYGGLTEAITSLSIVTSAASAGTATLNILALALANLLGGLFIIGHNLWELKNDQSSVPSNQTEEQVDTYKRVLGKRENFFIHASVAILSFLVFGLVPPLVYGFSFRESNDTDLKIAAVAGASLLCIIVLAIGKAHIQRPQKYIKTVLYYISFGIGAAGVSYLAGELIDKLIKKLGWFNSNVAATLPFPEMGIVKPAGWESY